MLESSRVLVVPRSIILVEGVADARSRDDLDSCSSSSFPGRTVDSDRGERFPDIATDQVAFAVSIRIIVRAEAKGVWREEEFRVEDCNSVETGENLDRLKGLVALSRGRVRHDWGRKFPVS